MRLRTANRMSLLALAFIFGLVSIAAAQMMGGGHGQTMMGQADTTGQVNMMGNSHSNMMGNSQSNMMGMGMMGTMARMNSMMGDMSQHCRTMSNEFTKLQDHFDSMMKINDMQTLKIEMKKHQGMMKNMRQGMMQQNNLCQNMMSMMGSGNMHSANGMHGMGGMMESGSATSDDDQQQSQSPDRKSNE